MSELNICYERCLTGLGLPCSCVHRLLARVAELERLVSDAACCGVEFDDPRIGYVVLQMERETWQELCAARAALGEGGEK